MFADSRHREIFRLEQCEAIEIVRYRYSEFCLEVMPKLVAFPQTYKIHGLCIIEMQNLGPSQMCHHRQDRGFGAKYEALCQHRKPTAFHSVQCVTEIFQAH